MSYQVKPSRFERLRRPSAAAWKAAALLALAALSANVSAAAEPGALRFDRDIRPILSENCFHCHGPDPANRMADLRLDTKQSATQDRGGHAAVVPGSVEKSVLFERITADGALQMPPAYSNRSLSDEQIDLIRAWIEQGAPFNEHWAFTPPRETAPPRTSKPDWVRQPIDSFILARLEAEGLAPSPEVDPAIWLRRASLDLTGLPPTLEQTAAFRLAVEERGEAAYEEAVDRLLSSPRYGERMALDWLDVARYADTHGFNNDASRSMWRWRDWVIDSFNKNLPYDEFITKQLAGDLLPEPSLDDLIATGFNRNHGINSEGGIIEEEYRVEYVADRVRTVSMAWLGLTFECARCHDHKYDLIKQSDYYGLYAFFNNVPEFGEDGRVANAAPFITAPTREQQERLAQLEKRAAALESVIDRAAAGWRPDAAQAEAALRVAREAKAAAPSDAVLRLDCDSKADLEMDPVQTTASGTAVAGQACFSSEASPLPEPPETKIESSDDRQMTIALWVKPAEADQDAALFSSIDYSPARSSTSHGRGVELRLAGDEIELRLSQRYPAYSITVRSQGARLEPGRWRHVAAVYEGSRESAQRAEAGRTKLYVDGVEIRTEVLHDGLFKLQGFVGTPLLGRDNSSDGKVFEGGLDEIEVWNRALDREELLDTFHARAIPYAVGLWGPDSAQPPPPWAGRMLLAASDAAFQAKLEQLGGLQREIHDILRNAPTTMVMQELEEPRQTYLLERGQYDAHGEEISPRVLEGLLMSWPDGAPKNRLGLAQWLTKPDHPLTSRVVVNRFWQQLFGLGLVKTSDNFGFQGEFPSHPELLDWLARSFVDSGWDVKAMLKMLVLSAAYRQDSAATPELIERDVENRLLARGPRFRLPAEVIRDQALAVSGLLRHRLGGPSVRPYQPAGLYESIVVAADYPGTKWEQAHGDDLYRRSLYTFWKRTLAHPGLAVFDAPSREVCTVARSSTNTPLQALTLLNSPIFVEASRKLAERMILEGGETFDSRVAFAFQLAAGREPDQEEIRILQRAYEAMLASFDRGAGDPELLLSVGESEVNADIPARELAAYAAVAGMLLNLDEVITKG